jgi:hypothetical protein
MKTSTEELLVRLGARRVGIDPGWSDELCELVGLGLAEVQDGKTGGATVRLTIEGRKLKQELTRTKRSKRGASLDDLQAVEERIVLRISNIIDQKLAALEPRLRTMPPAHEPEVVLIDDLGRRVLSAIQQIDQAQRLDGIVPLHLLRAHLGEIPGNQLDHALLELERQYRIDLKIANDPRGVPMPDSGIRLPGRGLAYYAALR